MIMRVFSTLLLLLLPLLSWGRETDESPLRPLLHVSYMDGLQINTSRGVLLALAEGGEKPTPENVSVQYMPWSLAAPRQSEPDWRGLRRDTYYFFGLQWAAIGVIYVLPDEFSGWSDSKKENNQLKKWRDHVKEPAWDTDDAYINYILHPYWGATYYTRGRERGLSRTGAFWFSVLQSSLFEFGAEAFFEQPSIQDLIVTPTLGSLLGMYFESVRDGIKQDRSALGWGDKTLLVLTDPFGAINHQVDRLLGIDTRIKIQTMAPRLVSPVSPNGSWSAPAAPINSYRQQAAYLGLSLEMRW
ncbi:MAG: DUF3943 domain-containing protein [Gammaproteobacteria bacterium]|nr:DUF3943 domain-containing protein [Gammaproteobacteria bacterium]MCF6361763.1 DUF3943 domain-containing protein [Gammaproteobacteria bacterium]